MKPVGETKHTNRPVNYACLVATWSDTKIEILTDNYWYWLKQSPQNHTVQQAFNAPAKANSESSESSSKKLCRIKSSKLGRCVGSRVSPCYKYKMRTQPHCISDSCHSLCIPCGVKCLRNCESLFMPKWQYKCCARINGLAKDKIL